MNRAGLHPDRTFAALSGMVTALDARFGPDNQVTLDALSCLANTSYHVGDKEGRVAAIRKVLASYERQGRTEDALRALAGWPFADMTAHEQAGDDLVPRGIGVGLASVLDPHRRHSAHGLPVSGQEISTSRSRAYPRSRCCSDASKADRWLL